MGASSKAIIMLSRATRPFASALRSAAPSRSMSAYAIVRVDVHDAEAYGKYAAIAGPTVAKFGGEFLARGGAATYLEGAGPAGSTENQRNVIIKWPDVATALEFYNSPDYKEAMSHGLPASTRDYVIVEGA